MVEVNLNPKKQIELSDLNDNHIIGLECSSVKNRGFIMKIRHDNYVLSLINENVNNEKAGFFNSIKELIDNLEPKKVCVFDTPKELYFWMSEETA
jgi:hypothetical protein